MNLNKIKLNIKHLSLVLIIISFSTQLLYCQDNPKDESENSEAENVNTMVHSLSDSLVIAGNIFTDSLLLAVKNKMLENVHNYSLSADSIILDLKDSLSFSRKDSLGYIKLLLLKNLSLNSESITGNLANIHKNYSEKIIKVKSISFDDIVDASDTLGEINEEFRDTILSAADDFNDSFKDSVENAVDSLNNYSQSLLDNQNDENDRKDSLWDYFYSYGFFCKTGYTSDISLAYFITILMDWAF